ncbi:hypothetical protein H0X32_02670 [Patescibacteria group bacterium]|nr:hypothetical protein [Patescibacteria group bacterium]
MNQLISKRFVSSILLVAVLMSTTAYPLVTRADDSTASTTTEDSSTPPATAAPDATSPPDTTSSDSTDTSTAATDTSDSSVTATASTTSDDSTNQSNTASSSSTETSENTSTDQTTTLNSTSTPSSENTSTSTAPSGGGSGVDASSSDATTPSTSDSASAGSGGSDGAGTATDTADMPSTIGAVNGVGALGQQAGGSGSTSNASSTGNNESSTTPTSGTTTPINTSTTTATTTSTSTIITGQAIAFANILNLLNTNFINSLGSIFFSNFLNTLNGSIDLRNSSSTLTSGAACLLSSCLGDESVTVDIANNANIQNEIILTAMTGNNAVDQAGVAAIQTGNAYAGLNLINFANTNLINSNYLLATLNAFQGINGDIIFPNFAAFAALLNGGATANASTTLNSLATVDNTISTFAQSGNNQTGSTTNSSIQTGNSNSASNIYNQVNTNLFGGNDISILFRLTGNWTGQVFDAPAGLSVIRGADGSIFLSSMAPGMFSQLGSTDITASSSANIQNHVSLTALSGNNDIQNASSSSISTGDAFASANILNIANANVIGRNWLLAIVNVFGDFNGNIAFGRPDLWVGESVSVPSDIGNGSNLTYTYTVTNKGDADASDVSLIDAQDATHVELLDSSADHTVDASGHLVWNLGAIPAGQTVQITYHGQIKNTNPGTAIKDVVSAQEHETDNNTVDNTDTATVQTSALSNTASGNFYPPAPQNTEVNKLFTPDVRGVTTSFDLTVERVTASSTVKLSDSHSVHQELVITNTSDATSTPITLHDVLSDPKGAVVHDDPWQLATLSPHEQITVAYDFIFATDAPVGLYSLSTTVDGGDAGTATSDHNGTILVVQSSPAASGHHTSHSLVKTSDLHVLSEILETPKAHAAGNVSNISEEVKRGITPLDEALLGLILLFLFIGVGWTYVRRR